MKSAYRLERLDVLYKMGEVAKTSTEGLRRLFDRFRQQCPWRVKVGVSSIIYNGTQELELVKRERG